MDRDRDTIWTRRRYASSSRCFNVLFILANECASCACSRNLGTEPTTTETRSENTAPRNYGSKRFGATSDNRTNPFNTISPLATSSITSPNPGASSAFGLGSGAFGFGSAAKTPKTPGTAFDFAQRGLISQTSAAQKSTPPTPLEVIDKKLPTRTLSTSTKTTTSSSTEDTAASKSSASEPGPSWPLKHTWVIWYRPPTSKNTDYEKSMKPLCKIRTAQEFWRVYSHLKRPSALPSVSDYHFFRDGIRPVWEDSENKKGGKWILRLKKGVADRYWEELLMGMVGDQFAEAGEEVCGAVLSVRGGEDVFSVWTKMDGGRNIKIR